MTLHPLLVAIALLPLAGTARADGTPPAASLCTAQETVYFTCPVPRARWISLCGQAPGTLQYRFGRPKAVELRFPESAADGASRLLFAQYGRYQTERIEVRFENQGADYVLYDYHEASRHDAGVRVTTAGGKEREIACTAPATSRLGELKAVLRCDADSALNAGRCP